MRQGIPARAAMLQSAFIAALMSCGPLSATADEESGRAGVSQALAVEAVDEDASKESGFRLTQYLTKKRKSDEDNLLDVNVRSSGSSARNLRQDAQRSLPIRLLSPQNAQRVNAIVEHTSLFRRLPTVTLEAESGVYDYFVQHPHVAVSIWRAMDISQFKMEERRDEMYVASTGDGTTGSIEVIYRARNEILALCEGLYQPSMPIKPIRAQAVIHVESAQKVSKDGLLQTTHRVDLFVAFPSQTVKMAARIVSPISNVIMDRNFVEVSRFVRMMSRAMEVRPGWVEHIGNQLQGVTPRQKNQFLNLSARVFVAARKRNLQKSMQGKRVTLDQIMAPIKSDGEQVGLGQAKTAAPQQTPVVRVSSSKAD